jgi:hypothetical protein
MTKQADAAAQQLVQWIAGELASGRSKSDVAAELADTGWSAEDADGLVTRVQQSMEASSEKGSAFRTVVGWVGILVAFAALNGILYVGQAIFHRDDVRQAEVLERQLNVSRAEIEEIDSYLADQYAEGDRIDALGARLESEDNFTSRTVYAVELGRYNQLVEVWNQGVLVLQQTSIRRDSLVDRYNALVDSYNQVAEKAYSRWYLIPMPGGRRHTPRPGVAN